MQKPLADKLEKTVCGNSARSRLRRTKMPMRTDDRVVASKIRYAVLC